MVVLAAKEQSCKPATAMFLHLLAHGASREPASTVRNGLIGMLIWRVSAPASRSASERLLQFSFQGQLERRRWLRFLPVGSKEGCCFVTAAFRMSQQFLRSSFPLRGTRPRNANAVPYSEELVVDFSLFGTLRRADW